jgi:hypothetical protein
MSTPKRPPQRKPSTSGPTAPPESLASLARDLQGDVGCVRAIAHSLHDLQYQYISCRTAEQLLWLMVVLLDRLQEESDELARTARQLVQLAGEGAR